ncbi:hypothetical protein DY000_02040441 [Brassica cretica]|uniref:Small ribosomal subunit protein uS17 N-terminal domain-containing protein n=2 Tax=Brassica TaxID=3705 RepID=A0ABQ7BMB6_BRACR|nr:hypothetical protein DY000_02040441 [Brassica cretica]
MNPELRNDRDVSWLGCELAGMRAASIGSRAALMRTRAVAVGSRAVLDPSLPLLSSRTSLPQAFTKQQPWQNRLFDLYTLSVASCLFSESHAHSIAHLQTEKAFLKQPKVFLSSKISGKGKRPGKGGNRFSKNIGLGFKTPREAIQGTYIDRKCPFTGTVSIRGRILAGTCHSAKMQRTIIVRRNYLHFVKKYQRYEKRHSNIPAHVSPCFRVKEGDHVIIGQCRPLSKTVRFNVLKVIPAGASAFAKKAFTGM